MNHGRSDSQQPETVVVHAAYPLWRKHTLMAVARAKELQDDGATVLLTYCNATAGTCAVNLSGSPLACGICRSRVKQTAKENGLVAVPLNTPREEALPLSQKREIVEGVHSTVTSEMRQLPKDGVGNPIIRSIKRRYFRNACGLLSSMKSLIKSEQPERIEVFNGRHACSKFAIIAANDASIPFNTMEITGKQRPILFEGHAAHDRFRIQERMKSMPPDPDLAKNWYERRRTPSNNKFVKNHSKTFAPPNAANFRKKVSVFLSSQDEFESLGRAWKSPFPSFADVIREACLKNPDYLFCVRFHPNQASMTSDIFGPFQDIEQFPNAVIYYPLDTASTYALIDWSDVVVTFGSTVTAEACWTGKPAIMLGPSFYDQLDVGYTPSSMEEFLSLLREDLSPRPADNAACIAVYSERESDQMRYVDHNGKRMVPRGVTLKRTWLARIARTTDNVFCRVVKTYSKWSSQRRRKAA